MEFVIVVILLFSVGLSAVLFRLVSYLYVCVHGWRCSRCRRHHQRHLIGGRKPSSSPLFTCVTFSFCILRKVGLEWRCWRCVFYRRCHLFRAGGGRSLQYRDVMVMTSKVSELQDDVRDDAGRVTSPASGFVLGLRQAGVPVCVLEGSEMVRGSNRAGGTGSGSDSVSDSGSDSGSGSDSDSGRVVDRAGWESRVADVAVSRTDRVTVSECECVQGLERRVVVWLPGRHQRFDTGDSDEEIEARDRLYAVSRCTSQLVVVDVPSGP